MIKLNIQRFGHTNSTTNYELPQFIGTDKPQWLTDINQAFLAIDTAVYNASSSATLANTSIGTLSDLTTTAKTDLVSAINEVDSDLGTLSTTVANHTIAIGDNTTAIGTLANLSTTAKTDLVSAVNEVDNVATTNATKIGDLTNLDTTEKSNLVGAINEVNTKVESQPDFNINTFNSYNVSTYRTSGGTLSGSITIAKNTDGSIAKIYGQIDDSGNNNRDEIIVSIPNTGLLPDSDITIEPVGIGLSNTSVYAYPRRPWIIIKTTGTVEVHCYPMDGTMNTGVILYPCLYFIKDFGDTPSPQ